MHLKNTNNHHIPIMLKEVIEILNIRPGSNIIDLTTGGGGHLKEIAKKVGPTGIVIALDKDIKILKNNNIKNITKQYSCIKLIYNSFSNIEFILKKYKISKIDGILCDLGISSNQLQDSTRGFTFKLNGPLDMRINQENNITAYKMLKQISIINLTKIIHSFGNIHNANKIAQNIKTRISSNSIFSLVNAININNNNKSKKLISSIFRALRMQVNNELGELDKIFSILDNILSKFGKAIFITFHSLEDKIVKNNMLKYSQLINNINKNKWKILFNKVITSNYHEIKNNSACKSAKLRVIEKIN